MRGEKIYKILDFLEDRAMVAIDFVDVFLSTPYGSSLGKFEYKHSIRDEKRFDYQREREERRKLQKYISKLKNDGLILEDQEGYIGLSSKGAKKLNFFRDKRKIDKNGYGKTDSDKVIIISYDIPVAFNKERKILKEILEIIGFDMIHKSVCVGKVKIPKQFLIDMKELEILEYIEILEVTKSGTLKFKK